MPDLWKREHFSLDKPCSWSTHMFDTASVDAVTAVTLRNAWTGSGGTSTGGNIVVPLSGAGITGGSDPVVGDYAVCCINAKYAPTVNLDAGGQWDQYTTNTGTGDGSDDNEIYIFERVIDGTEGTSVTFTITGESDPISATAVVVVFANSIGYTDNYGEDGSAANDTAPVARGFFPFGTPPFAAVAFVGAVSADGTTPTITSLDGQPLIAQSSGDAYATAAFGLIPIATIPSPGAVVGLERTAASTGQELVAQATPDIITGWTLRSTPHDPVSGVDGGLDRIVKGVISGTPTYVGVSWDGYLMTSPDGQTWTSAGASPTLQWPRLLQTDPGALGWIIPTAFSVRSGGLRIKYLSDGHFYIVDGVHCYRNTTVDDLTAWTDLQPSMVSGVSGTGRDIFFPYDIAYDGTTYVVCGTGRDWTAGLVAAMPAYGTLVATQDPYRGAAVQTIWATAATGPWNTGSVDSSGDWIQIGTYPYAGFYSAGGGAVDANKSYIGHEPMLSVVVSAESRFSCMGGSTNWMFVSSEGGRVWKLLRGNPDYASLGGQDRNGLNIGEFYEMLYMPQSETSPESWYAVGRALVGAGPISSGSGDSDSWSFSMWGSILATADPLHGATGTGIATASGAIITSMAGAAGAAVIEILPYTEEAWEAAPGSPSQTNTNGLCAAAGDPVAGPSGPVGGYIGRLIG